MAVINVNGISGISSITAQSGSLNFFDSAGATLSIGASVSGNITGNVTGNLVGNVTGNVTGNVSGNLTGNVSGNVTGSVNASGVSTFSGGVVVAAGSTAAPSISPTGDSNTGIFFPSPDTVAIGEGGVEALRVDSSGRVLVSTNSARSNFYNGNNTTRVQIEGDSSNIASLAVVNNANATFESQPRIILAKAQGSVIGQNGTLQLGDIIADISFQGSDGTEFVEGARIRAETDAGISANDMPTRLTFATTRDGTSTPVEWLRLDSSGRFSAYGRLNGNNYYGSVGTYADAHTVCRTFGVESTSTAWADQKSALFVYGGFGAGGNNQIPCASLSVINWSSGASNPGAIMRGWRGDPSLTEGTPTLQFQVNFNGNVTNTNNSYGSLSDVRYKQDITLAGSQWEDIKNISIKKFRFIDDVKNETEEKPAPYLLGCIAQEVAEVSPGLVEVRGDDKDEDGNIIPEVLTLKYSVLYMKAIKALQEAQERIETLESQNAAVLARLDAAGL